MKLIFIKLFFTILLLKIILSTHNKSKARSKQLFEIMEKQIESQKKSTIESQPKLNSLFAATEESDKINEFKPQVQNIQKNLFNPINFSQVSEKKTENNNLSTAKSSVNLKSEAKAGLKNKFKFSRYSKEIDNLKNQIDYLMKMNEKLNRKVNKYESKKEAKIEDNVISFIENYDKKVNDLKNKLKINKKNIEKSIADKEDMFSDIFSETSQRFTELKSNIKSLNHQVEHIVHKQTEAESKIKNGLEIDNLNVNNNLNINGILYSKKLFAEEIDMDKVQINSANIKVNRDTQLQVGNQVLPFENIILNLDYISKLRDYCGANFSKCKIISAQKTEAQNLQQENILKNLKKLRTETAQVMKRKHRSH